MSKAQGQPMSIRDPLGHEGGVVVVDFPHENVHKGITFQSSYKSPEGSDVADNAAVQLQITTAANRDCHFSFEIHGGGDTEVELYEAPTSSGGTALFVHNMNRAEGAMTPGSTVVHTPTVTNTGLRLHNSLLPGGAGP